MVFLSPTELMIPDDSMTTIPCSSSEGNWKSTHQTWRFVNNPIFKGCLLHILLLASPCMCSLEVHKLVEPPHLLQSVRAFDTLWNLSEYLGASCSLACCLLNGADATYNVMESLGSIGCRWGSLQWGSNRSDQFLSSVHSDEWQVMATVEFAQEDGDRLWLLVKFWGNFWAFECWNLWPWLPLWLTCCDCFLDPGSLSQDASQRVCFWGL